MTQFDHIYYAGLYPELKKAFGYNATKLYEHWTVHGLKEGRECGFPLVRAVVPSPLTEGYNSKRTAVSDINEHLPTLHYYASLCDSVVECGVRTVVSSWAFAAALQKRSGTKLTMVDPQKSSSVDAFVEVCRNEGLDASFVHASDLECPLVPCDLLFIDTWHVYGQLKRELNRWHSSAHKYIIMHDTTVDGTQGESVRMRHDIPKQMQSSGFTEDEIRKGLWPAVEEFLAAHPEWHLERRYTHNNGLTILKRV